jgi:hypothetical protein
MNLWRLQNGTLVRNWDHPKLVALQEANGPATRIMSNLLDRINRLGPQIATDEEKAEIARMEALRGTR